MKKRVMKYSEFVNETEIKVVYPTNFGGMVRGAVGNIQGQILAIARELAAEKEARNPYRYKDSSTRVGNIDEVDIARAISLIFHSDWKNYLKKQDVRGWVKKCMEKANKHDDRANKKNQRALRSMNKGKDSWTQASDFNKNNLW